MQRFTSYRGGWSLLVTGIIVSSAGCGLNETGTVDISGGSKSSSSSSGNGGNGGDGVGGSIITGSSSNSGSGSSSSSGAGGGSASSSSGMAGAGGATGGAEDCADGVDNDGDGLIDCGDTDCGKQFSCDTPSPSSWAYVRIRETTFSDAPEPCNGGAEPQIFYEDPDSGQCNNCSCTANGKCEVTMTCYGMNNCTGPMNSTKYTTDADPCTADATATTDKSCQITGNPAVPMGAMCTANGGGLANPDPFAKQIQVCLATAKATGCGSDSCVYAPSGTYDTRVCVLRNGDHNCPGGFPEKHSIYATYTDGRKCSNCMCPGNAISCTGSTTVTLWSDLACTMGAQTIDSINGCHNIPMGLAFRNVTQISTQTVMNCPNPMPSGSVSGSGQQTVCCPMP